MSASSLMFRGILQSRHESICTHAEGGAQRRLNGGRAATQALSIPCGHLELQRQQVSLVQCGEEVVRAAQDVRKQHGTIGRELEGNHARHEADVPHRVGAHHGHVVPHALL